MKYEFILDGLNCANCAGKIEAKLKSDSRFIDVNFSFATKKLTLKSNIENVKIEVRKIIDSIEDGVTVIDCNKAQSEHKRKLNLQTTVLVFGCVYCIIAVVMHLFNIDSVILDILSVAVTVAVGYRLFYKGILNLLHLNFEEKSLLTIAVIAAVILGEYTECCAVTVLFALGQLLEDIAVNKSRKDISALSQIQEDKAYTKNDCGELIEHDAENIEVGTNLIIPPFNKVPLDSVVTSGASFVDASALTGESVPVEVKAGSTILAGMINGEQTLYVKTTKSYENSTTQRILSLIEEAAQNKSNTDRLISKFSKIYTPTVILISLLIAVVPSLITAQWSTWIYRALVCHVSSCPCAVVISVPLSFFAGIGACSKKGVIIKGGKYLEKLAKAKIFAFDKTGTLTNAQMTVQSITAHNGYTKEQILSLCCAAEALSSHPIGKAIVNYAKKLGVKPAQLSDISEVQGYGVHAIFDSKILKCGNFKKGQNAIGVYLDDALIGEIKVSDTVRKEANTVFDKLRKLNIKRFIMLTGDKEIHAKAVASTLGDIEYRAELLPNDKVEIVAEIEKKEPCVFIGDGINDAPVMNVSSCAVAMGFSSDIAIESADAILVSGDLNPLPDAVKIAKKTVKTVKFNITFALMFKALVIILAALGLAPMWLAVFADTGVTVLCVLNSTRLLKQKQ